MLPKAHLTLHSRMSGSMWMIIRLWLSGSWRSFLYSSYVYSCHLLIPSVSVSSILFLPFIEPIFSWNILLVSRIFLKWSVVFLILLFSSISLPWSLRKAFLSFLAILWNSAFRWVYLSFSPLPFTSLLFSAICKAPSDNHFAFLHFFFLGSLIQSSISYSLLLIPSIVFLFSFFFNSLSMIHFFLLFVEVFIMFLHFSLEFHEHLHDHCFELFTSWIICT